MKFFSKIVSFFFLIYSISIYSQDNKLKIKSASFGVGIIASDSESSGGGFNYTLDFTTQIKKNLFSLYLNQGAELSILDYRENYNEINVTYGREVDIVKWFKLELHSGFGYFRYLLKDGSTNFSDEKNSTIGIPIRAKFIFYVDNHSSFGINPNINLNSLVNTYSANLFYQYNF